MTRIFSRPTAAFHAYELSLKRPVRWPPTRHDVPTLWERAKALFAVMAATITSAASLFQRARFGRSQRRELLARLEPVEKLVRILMMTEAATFLLMTPEGRKLRTETPKIDPPAPPAPVGVARTKHSTRILMPGWQTIAAHQPYVDPRVVEREQREQRAALERRIAGLESLTEDTPESAGQDDPDAWRCGFRVLRWVHPSPDAPPPPKPVALPANRPRLMIFDDSNFPVVPGMRTVDETPRASPLDASSSFNMGRDLARRIAALSRILANPAPAIRRLARRLAAMPADALPEPWITHYSSRGWHHGVPENWNACTLAQPAFRALAWVVAWSEGMSETHKDDPG